eukprot:SAG11_NODE_4416_length_1905_cov_1.266888_2_plen_124_part_00
MLAERLHSKPTEREHRPESGPRKRVYQLAVSESWSWSSNIVIIFNIAVNMCEYEGQSPKQEQFLEQINMACLLFFTFEMALKLVAFFPSKYWQDNWNKFDALVVVLSWTAIILQVHSLRVQKA